MRLKYDTPERRAGLIFAGWLAFALVFGGGGSPSALAEIVVQLGFVAVAALWFGWVAVRDWHLPRSLGLLGSALVLLPIVQLIPLPPALWQMLPERELQSQALQLAGAGDSWHALSVAPRATLAAVLALVPAIGTALMAAQLSPAGRMTALMAIAAVTLAGAVLGVLQMAAPGYFRLYEITHERWLVAFHANRNSAADMLLIGSLALTAHTAMRARTRPVEKAHWLAIAMVQLLLVAAVVMTGSRTGIALLLPVALAQLFILRAAALRAGRRLVAIVGAGLTATVAAALWLMGEGNRLTDAASRFVFSGDAREGLWEGAWAAAVGSWPIGSGVGSFSVAFPPFEDPAHLDAFFANRAHNDYLEFLIEAGVAAPLLVAASIAVLGRLAWAAWQRADEELPVVIACIATLLVIALHSIVDYPLRNMAVAVGGAAAIGLLAAIAKAGTPLQRSGATR